MHLVAIQGRGPHSRQANSSGLPPVDIRTTTIRSAFFHTARAHRPSLKGGRNARPIQIPAAKVNPFPFCLASTLPPLSPATARIRYDKKRRPRRATFFRVLGSVASRSESSQPRADQTCPFVIMPVLWKRLQQQALLPTQPDQQENNLRYRRNQHAQCRKHQHIGKGPNHVANV